MGSLKELTEEYLGSLKYVREVAREIELPRRVSDIVAVVGPRRAGKTFIMLKSVKRDLEEGDQALYVPLDEPSLRKIDARKFAEMIREEYREKRVNLYLDEIQDWDDWDSKLRWLHDVKDFQLYVTGSSSALQSSEIPTRLRGRYISKLVLPFSFKEVARTELDTELSTFRERGAVKSLLKEYLTWGGFPEVWLYKSREKLVALLETMFYRDIIERHKIKRSEEFLELAYLVLSNYANPVTWHALCRTLKSASIEIDVKTVASYMEYMRQAFLVFIVKRFSYSEREKARSPRKVYIVDPAIANLFERPMDLGRRTENTVFLELVRRGYEPSYYITNTGKEVDFITRHEGKVKIIEVSLEVEKNHIKKVLEAMQELKVKEAEIISWDQEEEREIEDRKIRIIPLWKWLLTY